VAGGVFFYLYADLGGEESGAGNVFFGVSGVNFVFAEGIVSQSGHGCSFLIFYVSLRKLVAGQCARALARVVRFSLSLFLPVLSLLS